jgi:hypothetical protein
VFLLSKYQIFHCPPSLSYSGDGNYLCLVFSYSYYLWSGFNHIVYYFSKDGETVLRQYVGSRALPTKSLDETFAHVESLIIQDKEALSERLLQFSAFLCTVPLDASVSIVPSLVTNDPAKVQFTIDHMEGLIFTITGGLNSPGSGKIVTVSSAANDYVFPVNDLLESFEAVLLEKVRNHPHIRLKVLLGEVG